METKTSKSIGFNCFIIEHKKVFFFFFYFLFIKIKVEKIGRISFF